MTQTCFGQVSWDSPSNFTIFFLLCKIGLRPDVRYCVFMWMSLIHPSYNELYYTRRLKMNPTALKNFLWGFFSSADEHWDDGGKMSKALLYSTFMCNPFIFYMWNVFKLWNSFCWSYEKRNKIKRTVKLEDSVQFWPWFATFLIWKTEDQRL